MTATKFGAGIYSSKYVTDNMLLLTPSHDSVSTDARFGIIGCHGVANGAEIYIPTVDPVFYIGAHSQALADAGFYFLAVDHARVASWGDPDAMDSMDDAYAYLTGVLGCQPRIGIMMYSMGGLVGLNWVKRNPDKVAAVVGWAPTSDLDYAHSTSGYTPAYGSALPNNGTWTSQVDTVFGPTITVNGAQTVPQSPATATVLLNSAVGTMPAGNKAVPKGLIGQWNGWGLAQGTAIAAGLGGTGDMTIEAGQNLGSCIVDHTGLYAPRIKMVQVGATATNISWRAARLGTLTKACFTFMFEFVSNPGTAWPFFTVLSANDTVTQGRLELGTTGAIRIKDKAGTLQVTTANLSPGEYRVEVVYDFAADSLTVTAYTADGTSVAATGSFAGMGYSAAMDTIRLHNWQTVPGSITAYYSKLLVTNLAQGTGPIFPKGQPALFTASGGGGTKILYQHRDDTHLYGAAGVGAAPSLSNGASLFGRYAEQAPGSKVRDEYASWRLGIPIRIYHGDADTTVPPAMNMHANGFVAQVNDPAVVGVSVPGKGHTDVFTGVDPGEIVAFYRANLGKPFPRWEQIAGYRWSELSNTTWANLGSLLS